MMDNDAWHIAQMNVGTSRYPLDDPRMDRFMSNLDAINSLAESSPGFFWRLQSESGNATDIDVGGDALFIVNMSVWISIDALFDYVYKSRHREFMGERRAWFVKPTQAYQVLWWIKKDHTPTAAEGLERLELLRASGPSPSAFTFKERFAASDLI